MGGVEAAVALALFVQLCGLVFAFGAFSFAALILAHAALGEGVRASLAARLVWIARASLLLALIGALSRLSLQAVAIGAAGGVGEIPVAVTDLVRFSRFGRGIAGEGVLLAVALFTRGRAGAALTGLALVLLAGSGHAAAMPGWRGEILWGVASLHVLAASFWLGGIVPLWLLLGRLEAKAAVAPVARFSALAIGAVIVLALSAATEGGVLVGSIAALPGSLYGRVILAKLLLFLTLIGYGARNRAVLLPALAGAEGWVALATLRQSLSRAWLFALAVLLAASFLASLAPPFAASGGEGSEQAAACHVFAGAPFRMPLHADREMTGLCHPHPFDRAIGGNGFDREPGRWAVDRLLMHGVHHDLGRADDLGELAGKPHRMARGIARLAFRLMAEMDEALGRITQPLDQAAT